jgi:hypothetical protein
MAAFGLKTENRTLLRALSIAGVQNLTALIGTAFQIDMVGTYRLARLGILDPVGGFDTIMGPAHVALGLGGFSLRDCHGLVPYSINSAVL